MGVEMYLGQSHQQASGVSTVLSNRITAYESICASLESFIGATNLQGKTYSSAKDYTRQVLVPLLKGCILLDEAIKEACAKLPSEYRIQVDQIDLREDDLRDKIQRAGLLASRYEYLATLERQKETPDLIRASHLSRSAGRYMEIEQRLQEKLQKLLAFNSSSVHIFAHIQPLLDAVQQGLKQTNGVWQADKKVFRLPDVKDMSWTKTVEEKWDKSPLGIQQLIDKVESGANLSTKEMNALSQYLIEHPQTELSDKVLNALQYTSANNISVNYDDIEGFLNTVSYGITGVLATTEGVASYSKIKNGTGQIAKGSGLKGAAKSVGILGSALAVFDGVTAYYERVDEYGQTSAAIDGVAHAGTAVGSIYVGAAVGSLIPIPVVGTVAGAAAGYIVGGLANTLYAGLAHGKWNWDNFALW